MKDSILFVDMTPPLLPLVKAIADKGFWPILMGPIAHQARKVGISCGVFEEFSHTTNYAQATQQVQRIADGLASVTRTPEVQGTFGSSFGSFLPHTGKVFFQRLLKLAGEEVMALETFEQLVRQCNVLLVVFRTENAPVERTLINQAANHGIPTLQLAHGIYPVSIAPIAGEYNRKLHCDYMAAYGDRALECMKKIGYESKKIFLTGSPYWDSLYKQEAKLDQVEARKQLQLREKDPVVLFCTTYVSGSSAFYASLSRQFTLAHLAVIKALKSVHSNVQLIVRPHPWEIERAGLTHQQKHGLLETYKEWLRKQGLHDVSISTENKVETIRASDVVIVVGGSTIIPELMILERPVLVLPLDSYYHSPYTAEDGIMVVGDYAQLPTVLNDCLRDTAKRIDIVKQQRQAVQGLNFGDDGKAMERVVDVCIQLARNSLREKGYQSAAMQSDTYRAENNMSTSHENENAQLLGHTFDNQLDNEKTNERGGMQLMKKDNNIGEFSVHSAGQLSKGAVLDVGLKCTHSCGFCYYSYLDKSDDQFKGMRRANFRSLEECKEILRLLKINGFLNFDYTGGEATLHPDIIEITQYAHQEIGLKGRMITLGQFLMQKMKKCEHSRLIDDLLEAGLTNFLLSIHAADEELFHKITGESYEKLHSAMCYLDEKRFHYTTNTVVFEWNYKHLPKLAKELTKHEVYLHNFIIMNAYYEWNKDGRAFGVQAKYSNIYPYLKEAVDILESHNIGVNIRYAPLCTLKGMEKNLVGMVGVRYDPYEWMNAAGHFGGSPEQCAAVLPINEGEIEQHLAFRKLNGALEGGVKITGARGDVKYFTEPCERCAARNVCDGIDGNYLKLYGQEEFSAFKDSENAPLQKARYGYTIPFIVKTEQYADMKQVVAEEFKKIQSQTASTGDMTVDGSLIQIDRSRCAQKPLPTATRTPEMAMSFNESSQTQSSTSPSSHSGCGPKVSVVVVSYNYARYLPEAVESVLNQSYPHLEVIIVNDGSTDNTAEVAEQLTKLHPHKTIKVINQKNAGQPAISRNIGIHQTRGEYILCLDADDKIAPTMIEECVHILDQDPTVSIVYTDRLDFDGVDQVVQAGEYSFPLLRYANHISYCALFRRKVWEDIGGYRTNVKGCEDWDFWVAAGAQGHFGRRIPKPLFLYRRHDTGVYQEALAHYQERAAQIIINNREAYESQAVLAAEQLISSLSEKRHSLTGRPMVSVIIPTYNRPEMLLDAVRSVLSQTYENLEILVINDGGNDLGHTLSALDQSEKINYVRLGMNRERSHARNLGLRMARGKYIAYLDDDDRYYPHHVETLVTFLETTGQQVAYSDARRVVQELKNGEYVAKDRDVPYSVDFNSDSILVENYVPMLCLMHAKSCIDTVEGFDETLSTHEDWDLLIRLSRKFSVHHVKQVTAEFTWREDGSTTTSKRPEDFVKTRQVIYEKYKNYSMKSPRILELQRGNVQHSSNPSCGYECSIIIPVFNKVELTQQCLLNLAQVTQGVNYEVIVVDNASTDGTQDFLRGLEGDVQIIRNEENFGFAKACNQGAGVARSQYLVFLNNDTIPKTGWLQALVKEVETHPDVAVVGSKLLFPDGKIQHAGVVFSRDIFTPYHVYARFPNHSSSVNRRREFKAVTAACMLVRRESFESVDGFDEGYKNGFEDIDFCLKIGLEGRKIIYQPASELIHLESQTEGRHNYNDCNVKRFLNRWKHLWLEDEDMKVFEDGYIIRTTYDTDQGNRQLIQKPSSEIECDSWAKVAEVQRILNQVGNRRNVDENKGALIGRVRDILTPPEEWPEDAAVLSWAGWLCHGFQMPSQAKSYWGRVLNQHDDPDARAGLARYALEEGNLTEAEAHLQELVAKNPTHPEAELLRGVLEMQRHRYAEAYRAFHAAQNGNGDTRKANMGLGMSALGLERVEEAWTVFAQILDHHPDDQEALHWLIRVGTSLERWDDLVGRLTCYLNRNPADLSARYALAGMQLRRGAIIEAQAQFNALQMLKPEFDGLQELAQRLKNCGSPQLNPVSVG